VPPPLRFWVRMRRATVAMLLLTIMASSLPPQPALAVEFPLLGSIAGPTAWTAPGSLVTFGADGWMAGYSLLDEEGIVRAYLRRSVGGISTDIALFGPGGKDTHDVSLGNRDDRVDVVWVKDNRDGQTLRYQRSLDGGASWSPGQALTPRNNPVRLPRVARDGAGHVAVVWQNWRRGELRARISTDGGLTFGPMLTLATGFHGAPDVAVGGGAIVIAYRRDSAVGPAELIVRRSTTEGRHWSRPRVLVTGVRSEVDMEAAGRTVIVGYVRFDGRRTWVATHRSADAGMSWLPSRLSWRTSTSGRPWYLEVVLSQNRGVWRAAYERCRADGCGRTRLLFTRSLDGGASWADDSPDLVSAMPGGNVPGGVGATATGPMVLWTNYAEGGEVFRRSAGE
jgi:hypothetical protein